MVRFEMFGEGCDLHHRSGSVISFLCLLTGVSKKRDRWIELVTCVAGSPSLNESRKRERVAFLKEEFNGGGGVCCVLFYFWLGVE